MNDSPLYRTRPDGFSIAPAEPGRAFAVNEFIHCSEGLSNAYMVRTSEGRVVINTGMGFEAPVHKEHFDAIDRSPTRYILLTQSHVDHVGGVDLFAEPGTEIVAQEGNRACQAYDERIAGFRAARSAFAFREAVMKALASAEGKAPRQSKPTPTITFRDRHAFELGGRRFELVSVPGGETVDSALVWLPHHGIVFSGNVLGPLFPHVPNLVTIRGDRLRSGLLYVEAVERLLSLEPEILVTGHFRPIEGKEVIRRELERLRDGMRRVHDETVRGMNEGKTVHRLMAEIEWPPELEVGEGYGMTPWNVRAVWEEHAGWFHQRSTTELYAVPPDAIFPELVRLSGGPDRLAEAARGRLTKGEPMEAIHLCEVALGAEPRHRPALETYLAAHERLLDENGRRNFWLTKWLEREIERTRAALEEERR